MDDGPVKKKPDMDKQRNIQAIKAGLPNKPCLCADDPNMFHLMSLQEDSDFMDVTSMGRVKMLKFMRTVIETVTGVRLVDF
ncbi:hypothetical protein IFM89_028577 [Coptis chinensis]|uniref:Uncharacterized protein n=1 Tax=Coptis chinensis TaxID=261450 RepID=A0A835IE19_9MAGN|nr:hypothetical protein IFM89_028577 [Coptis chinensis]